MNGRATHLVQFLVAVALLAAVGPYTVSAQPADGRVESATIERNIPLLSHDVLAAARDSGFICRGCTGPMAYRLEYHFQFVDSLEQAEAVRAVITSTSATLPIVTLPRVLIDAQQED